MIDDEVVFDVCCVCLCMFGLIYLSLYISIFKHCETICCLKKLMKIIFNIFLSYFSVYSHDNL
jgi:hypothetical protein